MIREEYIPILILGTIGVVLGLVIYVGSYLVAFQKGDGEKISPYECGFNPFEDARQKFQVKFYLVAILFLIFDLEVIYLFPWCLTLEEQSIFGYLTMIIFLIILTVGFVYEWRKGALNW